MVSAVRRREYPVKTLTSIVFLAFKSFKRNAISCPESGAAPMKPLKNENNITEKKKWNNSESQINKKNEVMMPSYCFCLRTSCIHMYMYYCITRIFWSDHVCEHIKIYFVHVMLIRFRSRIMVQRIITEDALQLHFLALWGSPLLAGKRRSPIYTDI